MKRFVWRLQRVLDVKTIEEQTKKTELFKLTEKLAQTHGQLLMQKRILEDLIADISGKSPQNRLSEQELLLKFSVTIDEQIKQLNNKVTRRDSGFAVSALSAQQQPRQQRYIIIKMNRPVTGGTV